MDVHAHRPPDKRDLSEDWSRDVQEAKFQHERQFGLLEWWYSLTAPLFPLQKVSREQKELAQLGRLTSATLLIVILLLLAAVPIALLGPNRALIFIFLIPLSIDITALLLNRFGKITVAGVVVVIGIDVGVGLSIIGPALSVGLSNYTLPLFDILVEAEFVAVSLLPPRSVFLVALIHSLFIWICITFLPHAADLAQSMAGVGYYEMLMRPISLQIIVAVVTYLWVRGAQQAIVRADRAEEIAALEQREIERQQQEIEQKRQLDLGIQKILETHVEVAKGNFRARAPLTQDNILWRIAYSLNNLLARIQSAHQAEVELQRMRRAVAQVSEAVRIAKKNQRRVQVWQTGTDLDQLIQELGLSPFSPSVPPLRANPPMERNAGS